MALWGEAKSKKQIARLLKLDIKTVRSIIAANGERHLAGSRSRPLPPVEALAQLYERCEGYVQRMHEILTEEDNVSVGYSTLTRAIRRLGIGDEEKDKRTTHVPDVAGAEMQHDTSLHRVTINGKKCTLICAGLYLRYSKMRYIKYYRTFNRFTMKCFMHEALAFWGYCAEVCIIDNTSLAVFSGTGADAVFAPDMVAFASAYGFRWVAHALGHANRKAGKERNFWTVETSFLPGRRFSSLENVNAQAIQWSTVRYANRPQSHTRLIPARLFENEQPFLRKLPDFISPPTLPHKRIVDKYGYIRFDANFYWIPLGKYTHVSIVQYADHIVIYERADTELIRYQLPPDGTRMQTFAPADRPGTRGQPRNLKKSCSEQERLLREKEPVVGGYVDFIRSKECSVRYKPQFIRELYDLSRTCSPALFAILMERALHFRACSIKALLRMAVQLSHRQESEQHTIPALLPQDFEQRQAYQQGRFCKENPPPSLDTLNQHNQE